MWKVFVVEIFCFTLVRKRCLMPAVIFCGWKKCWLQRWDVWSNLRCQPHARRTASVPLKSQHVQTASASCWTAVDAVRFVPGSSLKTAARHSHAMLRRDWSATSEGRIRESVEVRWLHFPFCFSTVTFSLFITSAFPCFCLTAKLNGRTCEYNSKIYQSGETFHPNCKHQCTCIDGAVGCVSLCPREFSLPLLGCAKLRRVKVPGGCCEQLVCPEETEAQSAMIKKHRRKFSKVKTTEDDLSKKNEFTSVWGESKSLPGEQSWYLLHLSLACFHYFNPPLT